ncbi:hypothetical protein L6164_007187 [Bauhinia variegata]|uniref:Uncharacterized protein n=1 Tax=Bauhinia variegata TaxID=167791 RepID=A0ACB9PWR2_BAUVA|nr:hypothetical protein L6164_007187 [Bauhinia variegata]
MEMEMRAKENIDIAVDITPPISPLAFSLHDSFLHSRCSSCFSPLPSSPHRFPPLLPNFRDNFPHVPTVFYCSPQCSSSDSTLHFSSAEHHLLLLLQSPHSLSSFASVSGDTSDLRAALRFLQSQHVTWRSDRIAGLLTNRDKLMGQESSEDEVAEKIRIGARAMAFARKMLRSSEEELDDAVVEEATIALCLVLTNAVEVQDNIGRSLGIAVYDPIYCWINHSCSPNACYRFALSSPSSPTLVSGELNLHIAPFTRDSQETQMDGEFYHSSSKLPKEEKEQSYGPRVIVRSIKKIKKGEEVTVAYTDLLQPKAMRQSELWSRYRFLCCCRRCSIQPFTYVDHALQEISAVCLDSSGSVSNYKSYREDAARRLSEYVDDIISEYLSVGDPESCCEKLESILAQGLNLQLEGNEGKLHSTFKLHPLHHLSLSVYTTLASAYKMHACGLLSLYSERNENQLEAFDMNRTSAAYYLLLAGATHHLFLSEPSLMASVANFWIDAGESLLFLSRSSGQIEFVKRGLDSSKLSSFAKLRCSKCSLMDSFETCTSNGQFKSADFESVSNEYEGSCGVAAEQGGDQTDHRRMHFFKLGIHCLLYGRYLAGICYGHPSHLTCHVHKEILMNYIV